MLTKFNCFFTATAAKYGDQFCPGWGTTLAEPAPGSRVHWRRKLLSAHLETVHGELRDQRHVLGRRRMRVLDVVEVCAVHEQPLPPEVVALVVLAQRADLQWECVRREAETRDLNQNTCDQSGKHVRRGPEHVT